MDAAKLHDVATDIDNEIRNFEIEDRFSGMIGSLQRLIEPNEVESGKQLKDLENQLRERLKNLVDALHSCPSNEFRPSQVKILKTIGGEDWTGKQLAERIRGVLQNEPVRSQSAHSQLSQMLDEFQEFKHQVRKLREAMDDLDIPIVSLGGNETELGFLIPMQPGEVRLSAIQEEFKVLDHHLKHLSEATGNRVDSVRVRAIATDSIELFVGGTLATGLALASIAEKLTNVYKTVQEIRLHHREIKQRDAELEYITEEDIDGVIDRKLDEIRDEVMEFAPDDIGEGRRNELRKPVKDALEYLADLIDRGGNFEVTVLLPPDGKPEEEEDVDVRGWTSFRELYQQGGAMARFKHADRKILGMDRAAELPEGEADEDEIAEGEREDWDDEAELEPEEETMEELEEEANREGTREEEQ